MRDKNIIKQRVLKRVFLKRVKKRLENDVGIYFNLLAQQHVQNPNFPKVGFWAGIRLMMPVIDSLSSVLMRASRTDARPKAVRFMEKKLEMEYPFIVWEMFRHTLTHGDEMISLSYRNKRVSWGLSMGLGSHTVIGGHYGIDINKLYNDLMDFLNREILIAPGHVYTDREVKYKRNIRAKLKREILDIQ